MVQKTISGGYLYGCYCDGSSSSSSSSCGSGCTEGYLYGCYCDSDSSSSRFPTHHSSHTPKSADVGRDMTHFVYEHCAVLFSPSSSLWTLFLKKLSLSLSLSRFESVLHTDFISCLTAAGRDALLGTCMDATATQMQQAPGLDSCVYPRVSLRAHKCTCCQRKIAEPPCAD